MKIVVKKHMRKGRVVKAHSRKSTKMKRRAMALNEGKPLVRPKKGWSQLMNQTAVTKGRDVLKSKGTVSLSKRAAGSVLAKQKAINATKAMPRPSGKKPPKLRF